LEFTGIQVRVQARPRGGSSHKIIAKQLDSASAATLRGRAGALADAELAAALRRLADHADEPVSTAAQQAREGIEQQHPE
jgi:hypothetical protein